MLLACAVMVVSGAGNRPLAAAPPAAGAQEVEVLGVLVDERSGQPVIVLQGRRDKRHLSMAIGLAEATSIAVPLQGVTPPRPLTHDLFLTLFGRLHVTVKRVVVTDLRDDTYYATVHLSGAGGDMTLDSRPSDAIALALRAKVPVLVEDRVFDKGGGTNTQAPRLRT